MTIGLKIAVEEVEGRYILRLEGRLDASSSHLLEKKLKSLIADKPTLILLDFQRIDYLSSAGLRLLLSATKQLQMKQGDLIVFSLGEEVSEIIKMAGFDRILHICSNEKEAMQQ